MFSLQFPILVFSSHKNMRILIEATLRSIDQDIAIWLYEDPWDASALFRDHPNQKFMLVIADQDFLPEIDELIGKRCPVLPLQFPDAEAKIELTSFRTTIRRLITN